MLSSLAYYSTVTMEKACRSETTVNFTWTARRYIPKGKILHVEDFLA
jgi:hypothetical protein